MGKRVIPLIIEDKVKPHPKINDIHWANYIDPAKRDWQSLISILTELSPITPQHSLPVKNALKEINSPVKASRANSISSLRDIRGDDSLEALVELFEHPYEDVRWGAYFAFVAKTDGKDERAVPFCQENRIKSDDNENFYLYSPIDGRRLMYDGEEELILIHKIPEGIKLFLNILFRDVNRFSERETLNDLEIKEIKSHLDRLCRVKTPEIRMGVMGKEADLQLLQQTTPNISALLEIRKLLIAFLEDCPEIE